MKTLKAFFADISILKQTHHSQEEIKEKRQ